MSLTPQQQYHILVIAIDELSCLAKKFGLDEGMARLNTFRDSVGHSSGTDDTSLLQALHRVQKDGKNKKLLDDFKKSYKEQQVMLGVLITQIFAVEKETKKWQSGFKKILEADDKELKDALKEKGDALILEQLELPIRAAIKQFIKAQFGVAKEDIMTARAIIQKSLVTSEAQAKSATVNSIVQLSLVCEAKKLPGNFSYHSISINGLYKFIKILNGIRDTDLAGEFVPIFNKNDLASRHLIKTFFAAETTQRYCREPSLLMQILTLMVKQDPELIRLSAAFTTGIASQDSLPGDGKNKDITLLTRDLITNFVQSSARFQYILAIIRQDLADRAAKIKTLGAQPEVFIKSAFYFGFISPLLADIELKLGSHCSETTSSTLRLELSTLFDILLGFKTAEQIDKIAASGVISPALLTIATDKQLQQRVTELFISGQSTLASTAVTNYDADDEHQKKKHQRRRSQSLNLGAIQSTFAKNQDALPALSALSKEANANKDVLSTPYIKKLSFYRPDAELPGSAPIKRHRAISAVKNLPSVTKVDSLESFFEDFIANNSQENVVSFILSLIRVQDETRLNWGINVLNQALGKKTKQIAQVLMEQLSTKELDKLFVRLFYLEPNDITWCRGNKLLAALIQQCMTSKAGVIFNEFILAEADPLLSLIRQLKTAQGKPLDNSFTPIAGNEPLFLKISTVFLSALEHVLSPTQFPPMMQHILQIGYEDLLRRTNVFGDNETRDRVLMSFILLRFINPVFPQLTTEGAILISAIQSIASRLSTLDVKEKTAQATIFEPITKNVELRERLFRVIASELQFNANKSSASLSSGQNTDKAIDVNVKQLIDELSVLLEQEFPSLNFRGSLVMSPRRESRPSACTMFADSSPQGTKDRENQPVAAPSGY